MAVFAFASSVPAATQGADTIVDDADELTASEEQEVQQAFDAAQEEAGRPLYAFLTPQTGVDDRKKREGEEKLSELEARLAQAKANEHLMDPYQRQRLREYEYQLGNARYGFFGGDRLTALLLFEALDNDFMYAGDPSAGFGDGRGDFGGGDF